MTDLVILAVSRLSSGVCVAGMTKEGIWIRPTRPNSNDSWRQLEYDDCYDAKKRWIVCKGNIVKIDLLKPIPQDNHSEDWQIGKGRPELIEKLSETEYKNFCVTHSENAIKEIEDKNAHRSLILIHPTMRNFSFATERSWEGDEKYRPRCSFAFEGRRFPNVVVSDAEWRGYGRKKLRSNQTAMKASEVFQEMNVQDCWLTLGKNQIDSNIYWLVVGIHLFPTKHFEMDLLCRNLCFSDPEGVTKYNSRGRKPPERRLSVLL